MVLDEFGNEVVRPKEHHDNLNTQTAPNAPEAAEEPKQTKIEN